MTFLEKYWNQKIDAGLAKNGKVDVHVDLDWKMKIVEERGVVINPELIVAATDKIGRHMATPTVFTITREAAL